nr:efflux RND transporter periplasmic adaptor subunit [Oscillatoria sp. FACHB-1406]
MNPRKRGITRIVSTTLLLVLATGCTKLSGNRNASPAAAQRSRSEGGPIAADVSIARLDTLTAPIEYAATTRPFQEVTLRSQVEGRLLSLNVNVGDRVARGQTLARVDDSLLLAQVAQASAELAARESELAQARARVGSAQTQLERTRVELQQAQNDAARYAELAKAGATAQREAETYQTAARVAQQAVLAATQEVRSQQQAVESAAGRIAAQRAAVAQQQQRRAYASLVSPLSGVVLEKLSEPGNLVTPGGEVLKLGDLAQIKIVASVSELDLPRLRLGQSVTVSLDAFPKQTFNGTIDRISPLADATTRQIPIEILLPNPNGEIGSGLLARVQFQGDKQQRVIVPEAAIREAEGKGATVFVVGEDKKVTAREVTIGERSGGKIEIRVGLLPGDRFVVNSNKPLKNGDTIRPSILSQPSPS